MAEGDRNTADDLLQPPPRYTSDPDTNFQSISDWQIGFYQTVRNILNGFEDRLAQIESVRSAIRTLTQYQSADEKVSSLPSDNSKNVVYSVEVGDLAAGDDIFVAAHASVTNGTASNASIGMQLTLGADPDSIGDVTITVANADALIAGETDIIQRVGFLPVPESFTPGYVQVLLYSTEAVDIDDAGEVKVVVSRQAEGSDNS